MVIPVQYGQENDKIIMCFVNDIHEQKEREHFVMRNINKAESGVNVLTGLYRRTTFLKQAEEFLQDVADNAYCLMAIDIEHFKLFNEWHGQTEGDAFLVDVAFHLKQAQEMNGGVAGYFGDDDFVIL